MLTSRITAAISIIVMMVSGCSSSEQKNWSVYLENTGTYSSPRLANLNDDEIPDIILGAGGREEVYSEKAILALDGRTGRTLWTVAGQNQYVGSAIFMKLDDDTIDDVIIGGRWAQLCAISGRTGKIIWSFYPERTRPDGSDGGWYNFTTPEFVPDQDADGVDDIVIANGGDARAQPGDTKRPTGRILLLSSKTGKILANVEVPDGRETYMSVVTEKRGKELDIYFGTGGETLGGHLYRTTLSDIMKGNISQAQPLASSETKGFISSPVLVDINNDNTRDIVLNAADGRMIAIDGNTGTVLWQVRHEGTEAYSMPGVGQFTADKVPDFFGNFAIGTFPVLNYSIRFMVDGSNGNILYLDTIPSFQYSSTISADLNADGWDEAIVNQSEVKRTQFGYSYYSYLLAFDFRNNRKFPLGDTVHATNFASTPWLGDIDKDNKMDIIYSSVKYDGAKLDLGTPLGLYISLYHTGIAYSKPSRWSAFMGASGDGKY